MNLSNIYNIAKVTIKESLRKKILYLLLFLSVILILGTTMLTFFKLEAQYRIIADFSLTGIGIFALLFTISLILTAIPNEMENKTIYALISKPVGRGEYLLGKFLGANCMVFFFLLILSIELVVVLSFYTQTFYYSVFTAVFLTYLESAIVSAFVMLFSLLVSPPLNVSFVFFVYIIGFMSATYTKYLIAKAENLVVTFFLTVFKGVMPHFDYFQLKDAVVHGYQISPVYVLTVAFYGIMYLWLLLTLTYLVFAKKDL